MAPLLSVALIAVLVVLSAFFSSTETAIFTLSEDWLAEQAAGNDGRITLLQGLRRDPHRLLVTILVGNNVVNVAIASLTTALALDYLPAGSAVSVATLVTSFVVLIFGEIVPKSYGLSHARKWAFTVARPIQIVGLVLYPVVIVFDLITRSINGVLGGESGIEQPYLDDWSHDRRLRHALPGRWRRNRNCLPCSEKTKVYHSHTPSVAHMTEVLSSNSLRTVVTGWSA
jgi:Mg2+/Co2+ transporter CorB